MPQSCQPDDVRLMLGEAATTNKLKLEEQSVENLTGLRGIHTLVDFPEDILELEENTRSDASYLVDFPEELELGFH